jgi:hypothetical protein
VSCPTGKSLRLLARFYPSVPLKFPLRRRANQFYKPARLAPDKEGRIAIVTDVGRGMRWTGFCAIDEAR